MLNLLIVLALPVIAVGLAEVVRLALEAFAGLFAAIRD